MSSTSGLLLDTHTLIWWCLDSPELGKAAKKAIARGEQVIWVSAVTGWEMATQHRLGKLPEADGILQNLDAYLRQSRFQVLPVSMAHSVAAGALPGPHRDPFDRMLMAQAQLEKLTVVTLDGVFNEYGLSVIW
jgi:PIN domain nuclease of toxin-antitoxin system